MSEQAAELLKLLEQLNKAESENRLHAWEPIPKQREFLDSTCIKKALCAANRTGKTKTVLYELVLHLTGIYPKWWVGRRFKRPVDAWLVGMTFGSLRNTIQVDLLGKPGELGTGFIPKENIVSTSLKAGVVGAIDTIVVKHISGRNSVLKLWSSDQKREDFQGAEIDVLAFDEEPPPAIHAECLMRLMTPMSKGEGLVMYSFTPLNGQTEVWRNLTTDPDVKVVSIAMDDVPWIDAKTMESLLHGLPEMMARARRYGIPAVSSGQIFQFDEHQYTCDSFPIPKHWPRLGGLDIGRNHPTGAVALALDRESDSVYIYQEFKKQEQSAADVARHLKHWGVQFATSHDAFNETFGRGESIASIFKEEGLDCFSAGRDPWARIEKVRNMISSGRLFIFKDRCPELIKEIQTYSTKESDTTGKAINKINDDVVDAFTHAVFFYNRAKVKGQYEPIPDVNKWKPSSNGIGY